MGANESKSPVTWKVGTGGVAIFDLLKVSANTVVKSTAGANCIGVAQAAGVANDYVSVRMLNADGTVIVRCDTSAISAGSTVYAGAAAVSATASGSPIGTSRQANSSAAMFIEVVPIGLKSTTAATVSITDAGTHTAAAEVETALQEVYAHIDSDKVKVLPFAIIEEDGTALTKYSAGGAVPGWCQLANKEVVLTWDGNATFDKACAIFALGHELDDGADVIVHWLAKMAGAVDTPVIEHECYFQAGDTDCAGTDDEIDGGTTLTEYTATIANAGVPAGPCHLSVIFGPLNGEAGTDETYIYAIWLEITGAVLT